MKELTRTQWKAFWAAWFGYLLDGFDFVMITLVLTEIMDDFNLSAVQGASLISAAFVTRWFGGLVLGAMADTIGRRDAMVASIVSFSLGSLLCALAPNYVIMFLARCLIGFGMAGEYGASATYVIESWPEHMRNKASAFLISGFSIGAVLVAQVYRFVVPEWGWRALFAIGLIPIVLALWLRRGLPEPEDFHHAKAQGVIDETPDMFTILFRHKNRMLNIVLGLFAMAALTAIFVGLTTSTALITVLGVAVTAVFVWYLIEFEPQRWPTALGVTLVVFFVFFFAWPVTALLPTYLKTDLHYSAKEVSDVMFYAGFGAAAGAIVAGFTGDKFGTTRAYCGSLLVSLPVLWAVFSMPSDQLVLLGILLFFQQLFGYGVGGLVPKWMVGWFSIEKRVAGLGFTYNVGALGGAISPVVCAKLAEKMSLGTSLVVLSASLTGLVIVLVAIRFPLRLQRLINASAVRESDTHDLVERPTPTGSAALR